MSSPPPPASRYRTLTTWTATALAMGIVSCLVVPGPVTELGSPRKLVCVVFHAEAWTIGWSHLALLGLVMSAAVLMRRPAARSATPLASSVPYPGGGTATDPARGTAVQARQP